MAVSRCIGIRLFGGHVGRRVPLLAEDWWHRSFSGGGTADQKITTSDIDFKNVRRQLREVFLKVHPDKLHGCPDHVISANQHSLALLNDFVDVVELGCSGNLSNGTTTAYDFQFFIRNDADTGSPNTQSTTPAVHVTEARDEPLRKISLTVKIPRVLQPQSPYSISAPQKLASRWKEFTRHAIGTIRKTAGVATTVKQAAGVNNEENRRPGDAAGRSRHRASDRRQFVDGAKVAKGFDSDLRRGLPAADWEESLQRQSRQPVVRRIMKTQVSTAPDMSPPQAKRSRRQLQETLSSQYDALGLSSSMWGLVTLSLDCRPGADYRFEVDGRVLHIPMASFREDDFIDFCDYHFRRLRRLEQKKLRKKSRRAS